jgi:Protein of unknown function (DUF3341)
MEPDIQQRKKRGKKPINGNAVSSPAVAPKKESGAASDAHDVHSLMGWFETPGELFKACETLRDAGYKRFDAHTPFPVHGLEDAIGLAPSRLPWVVLGGGLFGLFGSIWLAWYTQAYDYPQNISGKVPFSFQAYIPVFFELTVLCAAFACFFGMWMINKLPRYFDPVMTHPSFHRATDDAFFICVEAKDAKFDRADTKRLLTTLGAREICEVA